MRAEILGIVNSKDVFQIKQQIIWLVLDKDGDRILGAVKRFAQIQSDAFRLDCLTPVWPVPVKGVQRLFYP